MFSCRLHVLATASAVTVATLALPLQAEDIDLFRITQAEMRKPPNVLFMIDNTANWNSTLGDFTKRSLEHEAFARIFAPDEAWEDDAGNPFVNQLNIGFMVFSEEQPDGGKVIKHVQLLDETYRSELFNLFASGVNDTKSGIQQANNAAYALGMHEAYQYFGGRAPRAGGLDQKDTKIVQDPRALNGDRYVSPGAEACHNYLILIGNGQPDSGENSGGTPENLLRRIGGNTATIPLEPDDYEAIVADEYSRFFNAADVVPDDIKDGVQTLRTYVIDVYDPNSNQEGNRKNRAGHALLKSIAVQNNQDAYYPVQEPVELLQALQDVIDDILAVNSVFAAVALPVSVNVRGTNLNQVYIGVFRPDADDRTRWFGNLKLYQLNADPATDNVFLADVDGDAAQSPVTGFINNGATSFWTHASSYWDFAPSGEPPSGSDAPDGAVVEKGGAAQQLRDLETAGAYAGARNIYTCTDGCDTGDLLSATPFSSANADVGLDADLIDWIRGEDNHQVPVETGGSVPEDEDGDGRTDDVRASVHGDVLHSQPGIVNYGTGGGDTDVVVFYGGNDGMIHAVRGGRDAAGGGEELWSFVPPEFFDELGALRSNAQGKRYFADGNVAAYVMDVDGDRVVEPADGDKVYVYATMRRGGRFLYAFDVTAPASPRLLWKVDPTTPGFAELGQTWSDVRIGRLRGMADPVAIFGAGYDPAAEDADPVTGTDNSSGASSGRGLFVVNARIGELLWQIGPAPDSSAAGDITVTELAMQYSMPAGPTPIDRDRDGYLDRIYIPDTGGQVWRIDLVDSTASGGPDFALWDHYKLADVGADQEFQYPVDVVAAPATELDEAFDAVLVGSGDREQPFSLTPTNRFYMFKDSQTEGPPPAAPIGVGDLYDATDNLIQVGSEGQQAAAATDLADRDGWFVTLGNAGEKVVGGATTLAGSTFFNTNQPPSEATPCAADLGIARNYAVDYRTASATIEQDGREGLTTPDRFKVTPGGGFPPTPVPVVVPIGDKQYLAVISGTTVTGVPNIPLGVRERVYWYREGLDD
ncbi:pilus assembly protein [Spectribacter hydrogenooxidans]|uniref:PilC/PilY family type IV pilus protein n=1 Tax=Spectribacter hydrogenoxidans TaxID=3075608 RepID=A0ABU3BWK7_9GAMM|nr:PilC/PilY family type IV pilus protein [Salinisphaera sp. W335]MDT0633664.1 PilC/PilY family type IV pilus protein [Salinisphaera sp. W335]